MAEILQDWVKRLGLRHQGALLTGIRGCDTAPKHDASKHLVRCYRAEVLIAHCGDPKKSQTFIESVDDEELRRRMLAFIKDSDHYPRHYVDHLRHCAEIVGYKKPSETWLWFYERMCRGLHLNPETEAQLDARLNADEDTFGKLAELDGSTTNKARN